MAIQSIEAKCVSDHIDEDIQSIADKEDCWEFFNGHFLIDFSQLSDHVFHIGEQIGIKHHFEDKVKDEKED